jgi:O-antigen ligase
MGVVWVALFWRKFSLAGIARKYWWLVGILLALVGYFTYFISVSSAVAGSNTTRWMLTDIAWRMFLRRPWTGIGVGSFVPSVGESYAFFLDFGGPQDAHGILQKIGTEQGMIGVLAFVGFIGAIIWALWQAYRRAQSDVVVRRAYLLSIFLVMAVLVFQIFNTQYYSGKFWAPLALAVISLYIFKSGSNQNRLSS